MTILNLCDGNSLFYVYHPPANSDGKTFVFFNALTGDLDMWEGNIGEALRAVGHGTLGFNFRGQRDSDFTPDVTLTPSQIVADAASMPDCIRANTNETSMIIGERVADFMRRGD